MSFEQEHDFDPWDDAEAFVTLHGCEIAVCPRCERATFDCSCCEWCSSPRCVCEPLTQREVRALYAKWEGAPARVMHR